MLSSPRTSSWPPGWTAHARDPVAAEAARLGALGQALDRLRPERRAAELRVLDEHGGRHGDVGHALLRQDRLGGRLEGIDVDDVARHQALRLVGEVPPRLLRVVRLRDELEPPGQPGQAVDAELHGLDESLLLLDQRPRWAEVLRTAQDLLLLLLEPFDVRAQRLQPDTGRRQPLVELGTELGGLGCNGAGVLDVALVGGLFLVAPAVVDDEDEDGGEQDGARDAARPGR